MARVLPDSPYYGRRGTFHGLVLRQLGGQTIAQSVGRPPSVPPSAAQQAQRELMYRSRCYGKAQSDDLVARALYAAGTCQRFPSAYAVAARDYRRPPRITALDATHYRGQPGDSLWVDATDDFAVVSVVVRLLTPTGQERAAGSATLLPDGRWHYVATPAGPVVPGSWVEAEARDRPGNVATARQLLEASGI